MPIRIEIFGRPRILGSDGRPIEIPLGKPLALLGYLLTEDRPVSRSELANLLWPHASREKARQSTRQAIWLVRRTLGEGVLLGSDEIHLSPELTSCDLLEFREAIASGDIDKARALWKGPLFAPLTLVNCRAWDHWLEDRRHELETQLFRGLLETGCLLREEGRPQEAAVYLREATSQAPHSVDAWKEYAEALLDAGEVNEAEDALKEMSRQALDEDDGPDLLSPLLNRLKEVRAKRAEPSNGGRIGDNLEFVGRSEEMAALRSYWKRKSVGGSGIVSVLGPAGIGKSRLCREFIAFSEINGGHAATARGYESEDSIPHGTAADLVASLLDLPGAAGISSASDALLRSIVPSKNGRKLGMEEGVPIHPAALADALADLVESVSFEAPLVVWIDDYQWVDSESKAAFSKISRRLNRTPCLFLLAERTQPAGARRPTLQPASEALVQTLGGRSLHLSPLSPEELREMLGLLAEFTDPGSAQEVVARIHQATGGNPLFVGEVLRAFTRDGICVFENRRWILHVDRIPHELMLPDSVRDLLDERLSRVTPMGKDILSSLAVEDRGLPAQEIRKRTGLEKGEFDDAVRALEREEILSWTRQSHLDFTHDQLRATARERFKPSHEPRSRSPLPFWALGTLGMLAFLATFQAFGLGPIPGLPWGALEEATYPFGRGSILVFDKVSDSVVQVQAPAREGEAWEVTRSHMWIPRNDQWQSYVSGPGRNGGRRWFGNVQGTQTTPFVAELTPEGEALEIFRTPGDDGILDISPLGSEILIASQNLESGLEPDHYALDLFLLREGEASGQLLYRAAERLGETAWSPDGQRIASVIRGGTDTILVLRPDGSEASRKSFSDARNLRSASWCADSRKLLVAGDFGVAQPLRLLDSQTGEVQEFPDDGAIRFPPLCLGAGRGAAYLGAPNRTMTFLIQDFGTGEITEIPGLPLGAGVYYEWLPESELPVVREVEILQGDRTLDWGERDTLAVRAVGPSLGQETEIRWFSSAPGIVSVTREGEIIGNGLGNALIVAEYSGWIHDTIRVQVIDDGRPRADVLFRETLADGALPQWLLDTTNVQPFPTVVESNGTPALSLNGDGVYRDFFFTHEAFPMSLGATLEFEVRIPLTDRTNHQKVQACLVEMAPASAEANGERFPTRNRLCFRYPNDEMVKMRPDLARFTAGNVDPPMELSVAPALPSQDWVRLALQIRGDGSAMILLNGEVAFSAPYPLELDPEKEWHIDLAGASVDTEVLVRNLVLWRGARY